MSEAAAKIHNPPLAITAILISMTAISTQDMLIKQLSGAYPLHQIVFTRAAIGLAASIIFVQFEGGFSILRTRTPFLHLLRGLLVVVANMSYFAALVVLPLAEATALVFLSPLIITLMAPVFLGEPLGPRRLTAIFVGFAGVVLIARPGGGASGVGFETYLLPIGAAFCYAMMQILTRKLGISAKASALAVYVQATFLTMSAIIFFSVGDGRFEPLFENESLKFLLRAWRWPEGDDWRIFLGIGALSSIIGYGLSMAYRSADAGVVAPFEYVALPLALFWGWLVWSELPDALAGLGMAMIMGAGVYVFVRERQRGRPLVLRRGTRRY